MAFTSHGHHIPGTEMGDRPRDRVRCGGIGLCRTCNRELAIFSRAKATDEIVNEVVARSNDDTELMIKLRYLLQDLELVGRSNEHISVKSVIDRLHRIIGVN